MTFDHIFINHNFRIFLFDTKDELTNFSEF